ncbi:hypothetical protein GCM10017559_43360 [Streptosporangium longisporum]|uniref:Uncharacterized protein n=1 Tax=Streptosporangium longisporum TaxID=46187 RepID=A0ABP6KR10_9ACTN
MNTIPGTNPPPSIRTFFHSYGSAAATERAAGPDTVPAPAADAEAPAPAPAAPTVAHAIATAASALNSLLRMYGFPSQCNGQTAMHDQVTGP